jgi:hypothetical protein
MLRLSNEKESCENSLFEDYRLKSGILVWNLILRTSGRKRQLKEKFTPQPNFEEFTSYKSTV